MLPPIFYFQKEKNLLKAKGENRKGSFEVKYEIYLFKNINI